MPTSIDRNIVREFLDLLFSKPSGEVVACNIASCTSQSLMSVHKVRKALREAIVQYDGDRPGTCEELIGLTAMKWSKYILSGPLTVTGAGKKVVTHFINIIRYEYFIGLLDPKRLLEEGIIRADPCAVAGGDIQMQALEELSGKADVYRVQAGHLGHSVLWLAPESSESGNADDLRDRLGLVHYGSNMALVEVRIPRRATATMPCYRPTFTDAGAHRRFRAHSDERKPRGYGRAVNLSKLCTEPLGASVDGMLETVTGPRLFNDKLGATWHCLGCTTRNGELDPAKALSDADFDARFVKRLQCHKSLKSLTIIRDRLERLCSKGC